MHKKAAFSKALSGDVSLGEGNHLGNGRKKRTRGSSSSVNINDLAERAGVAPATVSRALNGYSDISESTRAKILSLAEQLNYRPSSRARQLARGRVEAIAFVLPSAARSMDQLFLSEFLGAMAGALATRGYDLLFATVRETETEQEVYKRLIAEGKCAGFILTNSADEDPRIALLQHLNVPFVVYGRAKTSAPFASIDMDNEAAISGLVDHLVALGHQSFAYIDLQETASFARLRRSGFDLGVKRNGLSEASVAIVHATHDPTGGQKAVARLFDGATSHQPTALVCPADLVAIGAIQALSERGFRVGRDVTVTGYDGLPLGAFTSPPLTTMSQPIEEIGRWLVDTLFKLMSGADPADFQRVLQPTLIRRQSDGSPNKVDRPIPNGSMSI